MIDEVEVSRAIIESYFEKLKDSLEVDVAICGGGPAGMVAAADLARRGMKVIIFEKKLSLGGGMWAGGMLFNEMVVQPEACAVLDEFGIKYEKRGELAVASAVESVARLIVGASEAGVRIFPNITVGDVELGLYGIGLQHEFSRWIDFLDQSPVALSAFGAYTYLGAKYNFVTGGDVLGENQRIRIDMNSWLLELVTSTRFEKLNFYGGLGYVAGDSDTRLQGTYEVQTRIPVTFTDPFDYQNDVSGFRANLGANLRLGWFGMNLAYTFQGYNNLSLGLNFNIR